MLLSVGGWRTRVGRQHSTLYSTVAAARLGPRALRRVMSQLPLINRRLFLSAGARRGGGSTRRRAQRVVDDVDDRLSCSFQRRLGGPEGLLKLAPPAWNSPASMARRYRLTGNACLLRSIHTARPAMRRDHPGRRPEARRSKGSLGTHAVPCVRSIKWAAPGRALWPCRSAFPGDVDMEM